MRRWTLITIILLFLAIAAVAAYQIRLATSGEPDLPGPDISPGTNP